jgi:cytidylate kinase
VAVWDVLAHLWAIGRRFDQFDKFEKTMLTALKKMEARLDALEDRMTRMEARQGELVTEARAAAGIAATGLASSVISDVVTRVTRIEMRQDDWQTRLPPPG